MAILACLFVKNGYSQGEASLGTKMLKSLSIEELMNIEVTSVSKRPEKLQETASAIQVITQEDIRHSGVTSVPEALRLATNLQVAQVNASQWAISARGFNNVLANKLLVLIDGRVVYTPMYAGVFWDVQNLVLEDIDRIEVISGPGGTLWGANAVNGVINIITKRAQDTAGLYAEAAAGTELPGLGSLRYGNAISEHLSYRVYSTAFKRGNTTFPDSIQANDNWKMIQGGVRFDWSPNENNIVTCQGNLYDGRPDPDSGQPVAASGNNFITRWNHVFSERSDVQVQLYYDQTWRDFRNNFTEDLKTYDIEGQHRLQINSMHEFVYGGGFRAMAHEVENLELFAFLPSEKDLFLFNIFAQDNIQLIPDKIRLVAGLKVEHYTYSDFQFQPNLRLSWTIKEGQTVWHAVSRAVKNPSRLDREFYLSIFPGFPFIVGHEAKPEYLTAYELGWHSQATTALSFSLSSYYNRYDNIRGVSPRDPNTSFPVIFNNSVEGNTYGAEVSFTCQVNTWWRLRGGYNFLKKELSIKKGMTDTNNASAESDDPTHQALIQSIMNLKDKFELGAVIRYVDELPHQNVPEYIGVDVRLSWKIIPNLQLSLVAQNLLDDAHPEFVPSSPAPREIERSGYLKIACRF